MKSRRDEESASNATCCKELLQVQMNLATALEEVKASSACTIVIRKERDAVATEYEELRSSVE